MNEFKLERYFAKYEFSTKYLLSSSDCESLVMSEVVSGAGQELQQIWQNLSLGYTESQGLPLLREMIAADYETIQPGQIIVAAPEELIYIAMQAILHAGDEVIVLQPAYQSLSEVARSIGCNVINWPLALCINHWELDLGVLQKLITNKTRMIVINLPHNPTGYQPEARWLSELIQIARSHNIIVFSDEMYRYLVPENSSPLPPVCDLYEQGISLSGLSKAYSAPGLRIGWLASRIPGFHTILPGLA